MSHFGILLKILSPLELQEIVSLPTLEQRRYIIAGYSDFHLQLLTLFRGDGSCIEAPFDMFPPSGNKVEPNFSALEIIDCGNTIKLGKYEAATSYILCELDAEYLKYHQNNLIKPGN